MKKGRRWRGEKAGQLTHPDEGLAVTGDGDEDDLAADAVVAAQVERVRAQVHADLAAVQVRPHAVHAHVADAVDDGVGEGHVDGERAVAAAVQVELVHEEGVQRLQPERRVTWGQ